MLGDFFTCTNSQLSDFLNKKLMLNIVETMTLIRPNTCTMV